MHLETQIFPVHSSNPTFVKFSIMDKIRQRLSDLGYAIYLSLIHISEPTRP